MRAFGLARMVWNKKGDTMKHRVYGIDNEGAGWVLVNINPCGRFGASQVIENGSVDEIIRRINKDGMQKSVHVVEDWVK